MKNFFFGIETVVLAVAVVTGLSAQQAGPDISGRWNRESAGGTGSSRWGTRVQIDQSGVTVAVKPESGKAELFRLDGTETAEALEVEGCKAKVRITKATTEEARITVTTWIVDKPGCVHREDEDDPLIKRIGAIAMKDANGGPRRMESITVIYRDGNVMTVETTTRSSSGDASTATTRYRK